MFENEKNLLEEEILENEENEENEVDTSFKVTDLSSANWCFKKIKMLKKKREEIENYVKFEKEKIDEYFENEAHNIDNSINYFKALLQNYVENNLEQDPNFKISTVDGTASFGKMQQKISYEEEEALKYAKENNLTDFIKISEKISKKEFNNYINIIENRPVTADGDILDFVQVQNFRNFNIKLK